MSLSGRGLRCCFFLSLVFISILLLSSCVLTRNTSGLSGTLAEGDSSEVASLSKTSVSLGKDDVFEVRVFKEPDLSSVYRVSSDGTINFPLIGTVVVLGKTPDEIEQEIKHRLEADFLKHAYVSVFIKEFNSKKVFVFGQVAKAGTFRYEDQMTIIQVITLAGGFSKTAAKNSVHLTRLVNGTEKKMTIDVEKIWKGSLPNIKLKPGDIIFVPETIF